MLRKSKYESEEARKANLKLNGNSEYRVRYVDSDVAKNRAIKRSGKVDTFKLNAFSDLFLGKSEYTMSFDNKPVVEKKNRNGMGNPNNKVELPINPKLDFSRAVAGRPYAVAHPEPKISETHAWHCWLKKEDRTRFEFLKNKCN